MNHTNNFPKLHNAAWPGVVGKGPDSEPPIDLDTMLDLTAAAEVDGVKFDGFDLFLFAPHVNIDASDDELKQLADKARRRNLVIGSVVAPVWPPTGGGSAMGSDEDRKQFSRAGPQGLPHRQAAARAGHSALRRGADRLGHRRGRLGQGRSATPTASASPRRFARPATSPRISASGWPPKAKSAGAACTVGGGWCSCWKWSTGPRRSAFRPTWPTRCSIRWATTLRKTPSCPPDFDWKDTAKLDEALKQGDRRPASLDDRFPRRPERRHGPRHRLARQDRPALPAQRSERQARHRQGRRLLAPRRRRQSDQEAASTSAGTAACSPTQTMLEAADLERAFWPR